MAVIFLTPHPLATPIRFFLMIVLTVVLHRGL
jgi:hypothetical protein